MTRFIGTHTKMLFGIIKLTMSSSKFDTKVLVSTTSKKKLFAFSQISKQKGLYVDVKLTPREFKWSKTQGNQNLSDCCECLYVFKRSFWNSLNLRDENFENFDSILYLRKFLHLLHIVVISQYARAHQKWIFLCVLHW